LNHRGREVKVKEERKLQIKILLTNQHAEEFLTIKNRLHVVSDAEVIRYLIGREYERMQKEAKAEIPFI
jgi:hypothetical protein